MSLTLIQANHPFTIIDCKQTGERPSFNHACGWCEHRQSLGVKLKPMLFDQKEKTLPGGLYETCAQCFV